jgi:hypothetical protein
MSPNCNVHCLVEHEGQRNGGADLELGQEGPASFEIGRLGVEGVLKVGVEVFQLACSHLYEERGRRRVEADSDFGGRRVLDWTRQLFGRDQIRPSSQINTTDSPVPFLFLFKYTTNDGGHRL